ncbi:DUF2934 domain-containing protein [Pseudomonas sp. gcc21]|uniref:DUF2934 domain-containing protein n=1 Tax=Pseudomonas sp. gcc21 TaxID=2726989 RepID=UPI001452621C|nr:DUF2934 domain-containing protein [Pseudomonas sp. gcc21]QJD60528.1 DUF2934 domain-containing protein [Pseudomonas sp. gcc21]
MTADEQRIRDFAYQIWESEGRPSGKHERHWEMARKLVEAENQEAARPVVRNRKVTKPTEATLTPDAEAPVEVPAAPTGPGTPKKPRAPRSSAAKTTKEAKEPKAPKTPKATKTPKTPKSK